ncbi:MAG: phosphoglycerate kinase [Candidatus Pacebacteria bacterium]|nr:phosphoglycerate kinase [Candidatus Paceibacterota bacterium]
MMKLKTLREADVSDKTILYRSPYDIGVREKDGRLVLKDESRIKATLPTLRYLLEKRAKVVVMTWVKRPEGRVVEKLRTDPHARSLARLLKQPVKKTDDCIGPEVLAKIKKLKPAEILMLENTRFHPGETTDDDHLARQMTEGKDLIVFDGFPQAHRIHASTTGILRHLPAYAGFYLEKEVKNLSGLISSPKKPFGIIIGGAKISDKIDAISNFLTRADFILTGGGVANVFLKAEGCKMGHSFIEDVFVDKAKRQKKDWVAYARKILAKSGSKIILPVDLVIGDSLENPQRTKTVRLGLGKKLVPDKWAALDIGPETQKLYQKKIAETKTAFLNGPMGLFENGRFAQGSIAVVKALAKSRGRTVIAGGDTIEIARKAASLTDFSFVSLAGGASLEFLAGKTLPALEPLLKTAPSNLS